MANAKDGLKIVMKARIPDVTRLAARLGVEDDGEVQRLVTARIFENLKDFMPRLSGELIRNASIASPTRIRVEGPQARFLFFGKTRTGAQVEYTTSQNPQAGPSWDRRMAAERGPAIVAEVQRHVDRRGR